MILVKIAILQIAALQAVVAFDHIFTKPDDSPRFYGVWPYVSLIGAVVLCALAGKL